jgi:pimeloyl-ACP methyl ester carboxylesterase
MTASIFEVQGSGGVRLAGHELGQTDDPPVLFLHGGGQTRYAWDATLVKVAAAGWRAAALDLRGHGESGWAPDGDYQLETQAADIAAYAEAASQPPVLVGASLGGLTSLYYASTPGARVRAMALVDVTIAIEPAGAQRIRDFMLGNPDGFASLEEAADAVTAYSDGRHRPARPAGLLKNLRVGQDGRYRWHWDPQMMTGPLAPRPRELRAEMEDRARAVKVPVLLVRGLKSDVVSDRGVEHLQSVLPQAEVVNVAQAGHMVAGDQNDRFCTEILRFLQRLDDR